FFSSRRRHTRSDRDWSSDVCSSDLSPEHELNWKALMADSPQEHFSRQEAVAQLGRRIRTEVEFSGVPAGTAGIVVRADPAGTQKIGRASCRERVEISVVAGAVKQNR